MLYILCFSLFQCSLTWGGVRCVHSSQECHIYYASACASAPSLGVMYGGRIPDSSFSASKVDGYFLPQHGRLNGPHRGWMPGNLVLNHHLQIDLGGVYWVCGLATQGSRFDHYWITKYKISLSMDNITWKIYQWNGSDKVGPVLFSLRVDAATLTELSSNVFILFNVFFSILIFMFTNGRYNLFLLLTADWCLCNSFL